MTTLSLEDYKKDFTEKYNNAKKLKSRNKDFEKQILKEAKKMDNNYGYVGCDIVHKYVRDVIKSRWAELEKIYLENKVPKRGEGLYYQPWLIAFDYNNFVIKNRWNELENKIIQLVKSWGVVDFIYEYCKNTIKGRWEELEEIIIDPQYKYFSTLYLYEYAFYVVKNRWPEAEKYIKKDPNIAYSYATTLIKDRWPEAEDAIRTSPVHAYLYTRYLIKDRWKEAEDIIANSMQYKDYKKFINGKIINLLQNKNYEEVLTYCDFKDFANIIKNAEKKHHIPDIIKNVMIASTLVGNNNDSKKFMMQDKVFKQKMKDFLNDHKGIMVDELIKKL